VLVDPPCSGLGTLQSRPDLRWRLSPEQISELGELQGRLLAAGAAATAPGGVLAYSVCTISRVEGDDVIERFLATHDSFAPQAPSRQLLPSTDGTDGFFLARLRRDDG
jgi:16S rRNA (cytosine967-C5)-methyltransferase